MAGSKAHIHTIATRKQQAEQKEKVIREARREHRRAR